MWCCATAEPLVFEEGVATATSSSIYALDEIDGYCAPQSGGPDVLYSFTLDVGTQLSINVQADFDPMIVLMQNSCGNDAQFNCNPSGDLTQFLPAGDYWLAVDGVGEKVWGDYTVTLTTLN